MDPLSLRRHLRLIGAMGFAWILWNILAPSTADMCLFHRLTGVACPSCGTSRAFLLLLKGDIAGSLMMNPLGVVTGLLFLLLMGFLIVDAIRGRNATATVFMKGERLVLRSWPLLTGLMAVNWFWSIQKGL